MCVHTASKREPGHLEGGLVGGRTLRDFVEKGAHASVSCSSGFSAVYFYVLGGSEKGEGESIY